MGRLPPAPVAPDTAVKLVNGIYEIAGRTKDVRFCADWVEIFGFDVPRDARRGHLIVTGELTEDPAFVDVNPGGYMYTGIDLRLVGSVGAIRVVIANRVISSEANLVRWPIEGVDRWDRLAVEGRFIIDGFTGATDLSLVYVLIPTLTASTALVAKATGQARLEMERT